MFVYMFVRLQIDKTIQKENLICIFSLEVIQPNTQLRITSYWVSIKLQTKPFEIFYEPEFN